jgi:lysophospholipase L1-like esterase
MDWLLILVLLSLAACSTLGELEKDGPVETLPPSETMNYLALGDSYTIGEGVEVGERWPMQLAAALRAQGLAMQDPQIIARTGWTTGELTVGIAQAKPQGPFDLVSLLIGVNNQYRGLDVQAYRSEFRSLLLQAIEFAGGRTGRVFVLSIPDWGVTPFAAGRERWQIAAQIDAFNEVNRQEVQSMGAIYIDITEISRKAAQEIDWIAADGLHPSGKMYAAWVELALSLVLQSLNHP